MNDSGFAEPAVGIVGVGLIGGSIAAALKARGYAGRVIGSGRNRERLEAARTAGILDEVTTDDPPRASLVVYCTPVDRIPTQIVEAAGTFDEGTLVTDAGSVKGAICDAVRGRLPGRVSFVGSHPLAGSEKTGWEHAEAELFAGRVCLITPEADTPPEAVAQLEAFWSFLGMKVVRIGVAEHDRALAWTSHMPHAVASALAGSLPEEHRDFAASGFRDTTRIAAADPDLWTAILLANAEATTRALDDLAASIGEFREVLARGDAAGLHALLTRGKTAKEGMGGCRG